MKKILSFLLISIMILSTAICVVAADNENRETIVSLTLDETMESYTLIIPSTVTIDPATKSGTLAVELKDANLVWNDSIRVEVTSANPDSWGALLVNTEDNSKSIHYNMKVRWSGAEFNGHTLTVARYVKAGVMDLQGTSPEDYQDGNIIITVDGEYPGSGTYTDTLTFTVIVSDEYVN